MKSELKILLLDVKKISFKQILPTLQLLKFSLYSFSTVLPDNASANCISAIPIYINIIFTNSF